MGRALYGGDPDRLFSIQFRGTGAVASFFGPCHADLFGALAALGGLSIAQTPAVLVSLDPRHALDFAWRFPGLTFLVLGAVFSAITGRKPFTPTWAIRREADSPRRFGMVFPSLMIKLYRQGRAVLRDTAAIKNPFYLLAQRSCSFRSSLLHCRTVIASQRPFRAHSP